MDNDEWKSELENRRTEARQWLLAHNNEVLPWHIATVLSQDTFDADTVHRLKQIPVCLELPTLSSSITIEPPSDPSAIAGSEVLAPLLPPTSSA